jgi:hypothetical protein
MWLARAARAIVGGCWRSGHPISRQFLLCIHGYCFKGFLCVFYMVVLGLICAIFIKTLDSTKIVATKIYFKAKGF